MPLKDVIHPLHRFKSSDWLKEGHMTWIIFQQCSCLETSPCVLFFTISLTLKEAITAAKFGAR